VNIYTAMKGKKIIKLIAIIGGGLVFIGGIVIGVTGYWPVARVGLAPITYGMFRENFTMADHFYRSNIKITGESDVIMDTKEVQRDLQRATMDALIEGILIDEELEKRYSETDLEQLIKNKTEGIDLQSKEMGKATGLMYGLTPGQFKELVLLPKAKQEILEGNITLQNGVFNDWLTEQKTAANVSVFVPALYWDGKGVQAR